MTDGDGAALDDGGRANGGRSDGKRADGGRADGRRADGGRADGDRSRRTVEETAGGSERTPHRRNGEPSAADARETVPAGGSDWVYVSLVDALPWLPLDPLRAVAVQSVLFEGAAILLAAGYDLWRALPVATVAILVATAGSGLMVVLREAIRGLEPPAAYRTAIFDSSVEVVMGVVAFVGFLTYLIAGVDLGVGLGHTGGGGGGGGIGSIGGADGGTGLLVDVLGPSAPAPAVFLFLLVAWDLCYRIGTGWWASVTGLWRTVAHRGTFDASARRAYATVDLLTVGFAALQLALVPVLADETVLAALLVGHVLAVALVSGTSVWLLRRD